MKYLLLFILLCIPVVAYAAHIDYNGDGYCDNCGTPLLQGTGPVVGYGSGYATGTQVATIVRGRFGFTRTVYVDAGFMETARQPVKMVRGILPGRYWVRYADGSISRHIR